jgi:hypothetical protein
LCTSTPITIISSASLRLGATGERTGLNRGKLPSSYQVTLDGIGKAAATKHWQVSPQATFRNRVSRRRPESQSPNGQHPPRMTLSSGMTPDESRDWLFVDGPRLGSWRR